MDGNDRNCSIDIFFMFVDKELLALKSFQSNCIGVCVYVRKCVSLSLSLYLGCTQECYIVVSWSIFKNKCFETYEKSSYDWEYAHLSNFICLVFISVSQE